MRRRITTGSPFEAEFAYSRAVVCGDWCFVAGTTGYDYATMTMPEAAVDQARAAFATIARTLAEAGFAMGDIVRVQLHHHRGGASAPRSPRRCARRWARSGRRRRWWWPGSTSRR